MITETGMINMTLLYGAGILFLILLPVGWLISAVWATWSNSVYTLVYRRLTIPSPEDPTP